MKRFIVALALSVFVLLPALPGDVLAGEVTIVFADLQRALNESDAGAKATERLQNEAKGKEAELEAQQMELQTLKKDLDEKRSIWNEETLKAKIGEFQAKSKLLQDQFVKFSEELTQKKQETEMDIIEGLRQIVEEVAKEKGYTYVFEASLGGILYSPENSDITDQIITAYNKRTGSR